jgi:hypothetical protein
MMVLILLVACIVGFGFYRGWFAVTSPSSAPGSNDVNVNLATDTDKMKEDVETVKDKASELIEDVKDGPTEPADRPVEEVRPNGIEANAAQSGSK